MTLTQFFQVTTVVSSVVGIVVWWSVGKPNREMRFYSLAPISWYVHLILFYLTLFSGGVSASTLSFWRAGLITHGAIILLAGGMAMLYRSRIAQT